MYEHFPSISNVYALVLQEGFHKNIGHGGSFAAKSDSVAMYVNSKGNNAGNANWSKGNNKKEGLYVHTVICLGTPLISAISFMDIHPNTSRKENQMLIKYLMIKEPWLSILHLDQSNFKSSM